MKHLQFINEQEFFEPDVTLSCKGESLETYFQTHD